MGWRRGWVGEGNGTKYEEESRKKLRIEGRRSIGGSGRYME
jgi:hypothetical protein